MDYNTDPVHICPTPEEAPPRHQPRITAAPKHGQIYWCAFWRDAQLPEMWKTRPVVVISYKNTLSGPCLVVPLTTAPQGNSPWAWEMSLSVTDGGTGRSATISTRSPPAGFRKFVGVFRACQRLNSMRYSAACKPGCHAHSIDSVAQTPYLQRHCGSKRLDDRCPQGSHLPGEPNGSPWFFLAYRSAEMRRANARFMVHAARLAPRPRVSRHCGVRPTGNTA
jgi:mRNA-degrading endonuclease toxin of MazEF toxin-antitoxin module